MARLYQESLAFEPVDRPDLCAVVIEGTPEGHHRVSMVRVGGDVVGTPTTWARLSEALVAAAAMIPDGPDVMVSAIA